MFVFLLLLKSLRNYSISFLILVWLCLFWPILFSMNLFVCSITSFFLKYFLCV